MKVRKVIIPAAGLGTRLLPATKAMAKEMLPIVDVPTIQFLVEEAKAAGIEDMLIITGKGKRPIEDHFDSVPELEMVLKNRHKDKLLKLVESTTNMGIRLFFIRQSYPKGLGDAVSLAKDFVANEPFVVMLGDDITQAKVPLTKQLMNDYEETHASTLAVMKVPHEEVSKYGVIKPSSETKPGLFNVESFVEKPTPQQAPSDLAIIGRYLFTPEIFDSLATQKPDAGGEIQLTDAIDHMNKTQRVFARQFTGKRYDTGNKFGYLTTNIEFGLQHPELRDELRDYIINLGHQLEGKK
ncbi:UTP--glucose-1-phosphate uridylyltransferase GalU [Loigolactobacillus backii]|uniref:UTP--glucose-1-phosphate uridylyltransferase GalU n=1 Tax=Loigolactobacillus backii TaxID=375175 RepID=UPI0007F1038C|nr:UTP--glucose-1-phosphate uridylyltransferase GalU [Loigolactobacillus backii]ANK66519.1 UTP--glucose-1-phosphate uridylyltransferase [Loigolactobacillus backii]OLF69467.1 UTP--glucose-1-phosphate uridylyltransferase [Loigolactobacillus backii]PIO87231.1 UTP--glucose-1-phosphate uridylyltransferase [Loigolactobacillus backii]